MGVRLSAVSETTTTTVALHPEQLRDIGLFGGLSDEALLRLAGELVVLRVDPGVEVAREGDDAHEMFAVLAGELEVVRRSKGGVEGRVALLGAGNWFGEMSIVDPQPRSATVRALSPTVLLRLASEDFDRLYRRDVKSYLMLILNISRELARRLRVADGMIAGFLATAWDSNLGYGGRRASGGQ